MKFPLCCYVIYLTINGLFQLVFPFFSKCCEAVLIIWIIAASLLETSVAMNTSIMFTFSPFINKNHLDLMFWNSSIDYCLPIGRHDLSQLHSQQCTDNPGVLAQYQINKGK